MRPVDSMLWTRERGDPPPSSFLICYPITSDQIWSKRSEDITFISISINLPQCHPKRFCIRSCFFKWPEWCASSLRVLKLKICSDISLSQLPRCTGLKPQVARTDGSLSVSGFEEGEAHTHFDRSDQVMYTEHKTFRRHVISWNTFNFNDVVFSTPSVVQIMQW